MSKKLLPIIFLMIAGFGLQGQGTLKLTRFDFSVGVFPYQGSPFIINPIVGPFYVLLNSESSKQLSPAFFLSMSFYEDDEIELGMDFGYHPEYIPSLGEDFSGLPEPDHEMSAIMLMPTVRINWLRPEAGGLEFYSGAGAGFSLVREGAPVNISYPDFAWHFNALGLRFGKEFGGFLEFGLGSRGLIQAGLSYRPEP